MLEKIVQEILTHHKGKFIGVLIGLLFSVLVITVGLLQTIFISICIYIGYIIGKRVDMNESLYSIIDKVFKQRH